MPNWCSNHITVRSTNQAKIQRLADAFDRGEFCDAVIPVPEDLKITAGFLGDGEEQRKLEEATARNVEKYGYGNWYDFCVNQWGTKWDFGEPGVGEVSDDGLEFSAPFDSAWAPPMGIAEALVQQGFNVVLYYYEPGMAFVGKYEDGCDDCYELGGETSKTVRAAIGDELDDFWGISDSMAEYEADNEEELTTWIKDGIDKTVGLKTL